MTLSVHIPDSAAASLREALGPDFERSVLEAMVIEAYRRGRMSVGALAQTLGMGVIEADQWLAQRGVPLNYSAQDLESDARTLRRLVPELPR